jgi:predicted nucleic acid-binding protein
VKKLRIYLDTSVFGGCFDKGFAENSRKLFDEISAGGHIVVISETTVAELGDAPAAVQQVLKDIPPEQLHRVELTGELLALRDAYIRAGVVGQQSLDDATHVAAATIADADMIVSWNFRHIVHFEKIRGYNGVNQLRGYRPLGIFSPQEVIHEERD